MGLVCIQNSSLLVYSKSQKVSASYCLPFRHSRGKNQPVGGFRPPPPPACLGLKYRTSSKNSHPNYIFNVLKPGILISAMTTSYSDFFSFCLLACLLTFTWLIELHRFQNYESCWTEALFTRIQIMIIRFYPKKISSDRNRIHMYLEWLPIWFTRSQIWFLFQTLCE